MLREELRELLRLVYVAEDRKLATVLEETKSSLQKSLNWNSESRTI